MTDFHQTEDGITVACADKFLQAQWLVGCDGARSVLRKDLGGDHPLVGHSVPNCEFEDRAKVGELMHDGKGMLLDFGADASLEALASDYGDQLKYVSGRAKEQLGLRAALIRPDGFVAWASARETEGTIHTTGGCSLV